MINFLFKQIVVTVNFDSSTIDDHSSFESLSGKSNYNTDNALINNYI